MDDNDDSDIAEIEEYKDKNGLIKEEYKEYIEEDEDDFWIV